MQEQKKFKDLKPGDKALHFCLISKIEPKATKTGKTYLNLELQDGSMALPAKMWDGFGDVLPLLKAGSIVKVSAKVDEYLGQTQLIVDKMRIADVSDNLQPEDFLPKSSRDLDTMIAELNDRISEIKNTYLKKLVDTILSGQSFEKYIRVPAGKSWHHSYIHGLLEHTLEIIKICDLISEFHTQVNKDILICGAILHDFGKTEELSYEDTFDYTDKGKLLGHIVIAANIIEKTANAITGFPEDLKTQVIHLVLSHQGKLEYASPVEPKTLEAIILYHADELSAKSNAYKLAIANEKESGNKWTKFLHLAGTSLYIPETKEEEENKTTLFD